MSKNLRNAIGAVALGAMVNSTDVQASQNNSVDQAPEQTQHALVVQETQEKL